MSTRRQASSTVCCAAADRHRWCREHLAKSFRLPLSGIVTRQLAAVIDLLTVLLMMCGMFVGVAAVGFLVSPLSFPWPTPSSSLSTVIVVLLAVGYLPMGWATVGRTGGAAVLGLCVGRSWLGWARAGQCAVLCDLPLGLLWSAVTRERRSLQDFMVRSMVVYDWHRSPG